jgi:uncharacterized membrane protein
MDLAWLLGFVLSGSFMVILAFWTGYLAYKAKGNRFELKKKSQSHSVGSIKHFWYKNRFKMWWYITFVLVLFGAILIAVGAGVNPNSITYSGPGL